MILIWLLDHWSWLFDLHDGLRWNMVSDDNWYSVELKLTQGSHAVDPP